MDNEKALSKRYTRRLWGKTAEKAILACLGSISGKNKVIQHNFTAIFHEAGFPASENPQQLSNTWNTLDERKKKPK